MSGRIKKWSSLINLVDKYRTSYYMFNFGNGMAVTDCLSTNEEDVLLYTFWIFRGYMNMMKWQTFYNLQSRTIPKGKSSFQSS